MNIFPRTHTTSRGRCHTDLSEALSQKMAGTESFRPQCVQTRCLGWGIFYCYPSTRNAHRRVSAPLGRNTFVCDRGDAAEGWVCAESDSKTNRSMRVNIQISPRYPYPMRQVRHLLPQKICALTPPKLCYFMDHVPEPALVQINCSFRRTIVEMMDPCWAQPSSLLAASQPSSLRG